MRIPHVEVGARFVVMLWAIGIVMGVDAAEPPKTEEGPPLRLIQTIPLPEVTGGVNHLAADARTKRVFLTSTKDAELDVIDLATEKVIQRLKGPPPAAAEFADDLRQLLVSRGNQVFFYDGETFESLGTVDLGSRIDELHYDTKSRLLCAGCMDAGKTAISVIDVQARKRVGQIKLSSRPQGFQVEAGASRVFVNCPADGAVFVGDVQKQTVVERWSPAAAGNYPMALDEKNHRLLVACRNPAKLFVFDTRTGKNVAAADIIGDADDMAYDPANRRIYVCGGDGAVSVIRQVDADTYQAMTPLRTTDGARNCVFVPKLSLFVVAAPARASEKAQLRVYQVPGAR